MIIINKRMMKRLSMVLAVGILALAPVTTKAQSLLNAPLPDTIIVKPEKVDTIMKLEETASVCMTIDDFAKYLDENEAIALFNGKLKALPSEAYTPKRIDQTNVEIYYSEKSKTIFNVMYNKNTNEACVSVAVKDAELNEQNYRSIGRQAYGYGKDIEEQ